MKTGDDVAEEQRRTRRSLKNCIAVCDVSRSMEETPVEASLALGVLVSQLSEEPWKGKLITFNDKPTLRVVPKGGLRSKMEFVRGMDLDVHKKDLQKVFDLFLEVAVNNKLTEDEMVKRVLVFSDMEYVPPSGGYYGCSSYTDYEVIERKYREKGYGGAVPEIVFWKLKDSRSTPVPGGQNGTALVSGYSKNLMKLFMMEEEGIGGGGFDPFQDWRYILTCSILRGRIYNTMILN